MEGEKADTREKELETTSSDSKQDESSTEEINTQVQKDDVTNPVKCDSVENNKEDEKDKAIEDPEKEPQVKCENLDIQEGNEQPSKIDSSPGTEQKKEKVVESDKKDTKNDDVTDIISDENTNVSSSSVTKNADTTTTNVTKATTNGNTSVTTVSSVITSVNSNTQSAPITSEEGTPSSSISLLSSPSKELKEPKIIKKGDRVIKAYVDEKTGKINVYEPGIKLEVSDFKGSWYPAKVMEVDHEENEVLVHYDKWSSRFDEWIKMDSNRLRPTSDTNVVKIEFKVGEKVEAVWSMDGNKYPGVIQAKLPNDYYEILFEDGFKCKKKSNQIFKLQRITRRRAALEQEKSKPPKGSSTTSSSSSCTTVSTSSPSLTDINAFKSRVKLPTTSSFTNANSPLTTSPHSILKSSTTNSITFKNESAIRRQTLPFSAMSTPPPSSSALVESPNINNSNAVPATTIHHSPTTSLLHSSPHHSIFQVPEELGKRKRASYDYALFLKNPRKPRGSNGGGDDTEKVTRRSRKPKVEIETTTEFVEGTTTTPQDETRQIDKNKISIKTEFNTTIKSTTIDNNNSGQMTSTNITPITTTPAAVTSKSSSSKRNRESSVKVLENITTESTEKIPKQPQNQRKSWSRRPSAALVSQATITENLQQQKTSIAEPQQPEVTGFVDSQGNTVAVEQTTDGGWICPVDKCGKQFRKDSLLHSHLKYYHPDEKIQYRGRKLMNVVESAQARAAFEYEEPKVVEKEIPYILSPSLPPPPRSQLSSSQATTITTTSSSTVEQPPSIVIESLGHQQHRQNEGLLKTSTGRRKTPSVTTTTTIPTGTCLASNNNDNNDDNNSATNLPVTEIEALSLVFESSDGKSSLSTSSSNNTNNSSSTHQNQVEVKVEEPQTISSVKNETNNKELPVTSPTIKIKTEETSKLPIKSHTKSESKTAHHHHHHHHHHHSKSKFQTKNVRVLLEKMNLKKLQQQSTKLKILKTKPHRVSQRGRTLAPTRWNRHYHDDNDSWEDEEEEDDQEEEEEDSDIVVSSGGEDVDNDLSSTPHKSSVLTSKKLSPSSLSLLRLSGSSSSSVATTIKQKQMTSAPTSMSPIIKDEKISEDDDETDSDDDDDDEEENDEEEEEEGESDEDLEDEDDEKEEDITEIGVSVDTKDSMDYSMTTSDSIMDIDDDGSIEKAGRRMRRRGIRHALSWSTTNRKRTTPSSSITVPSPTVLKTASSTAKDTLSGYNRLQLKYIERQLFKNGQKKKLSFTPKSEDVCVDIINCECGIGEEFGLMMQCELCQSWQHGPCYEIQEKDQMPQYYVCSFCRDTTRLRSSFKDEWSQEINKSGRLPSLSTSSSISSNLEKKMKTCNDLVRRLEVIRDCLRSTQIKIGLFNSPTDDPKLYRWHKVPTAPWTDVQNYQFARHYRGLLRRLLRQNRDDPDYVKKLRERIENYQKTQLSRSEDEKVTEAIKKRFNSRAWTMIEELKGNLEFEQAQQQQQQQDLQLQQQQEQQQLEGSIDNISLNGELLSSNNLNNMTLNNNGDTNNLLPVNGFEFDSDSDISLKSFFPFEPSSFYSAPENLLSSPLLLLSNGNGGNGNNGLNLNNGSNTDYFLNNNNNGSILNNVTTTTNNNNNSSGGTNMNYIPTLPPLPPPPPVSTTTSVNPVEEPGTSKQVIIEESIKKIKLGLQNKLNEEHYPLFQTKTASSSGSKEHKYLLLAQDTGRGEKVGDIVPVAQKFQLSDGRIIKKVVSIGKIVTKTEGNLFVIRLIDTDTEPMDYTEDTEDFKPQLPTVNTELLNHLKLCRPCKKTFNVDWNLKDFVKSENILLVPDSRQQSVVSTTTINEPLLLKETPSQSDTKSILSSTNDNNSIQLQDKKTESDTIKMETSESASSLQNVDNTLISTTTTINEESSVEIPTKSSTFIDEQIASYLLDDDDGSSSPDSSDGGFKMPERITTESCRTNLHADIVKQQALLDLHLDMIEDKLKCLEQSKSVNDPQVIMRKLKDLEELKRKVHRINSNISFMNKLQKNLEEPEEMFEQ